MNPSFDNASYVAGQASGVGFSYTTGSAALRVMVLGIVVGNGVTVTVTYNGVTCTQVGTFQLLTAGSDYIYLYSLDQPTSGAHDVVVTTSNATGWTGMIATYAGAETVNSVAQAGNLTTPVAATITTLADNTWLVGFFENNSGNNVAGADTTVRGGAHSQNIADSNAVKTPPGSYSLNITYAGGGKAGYILTTLALKERYWVGGTGTWDASDTTHWAYSSGGTAGAIAPTASDVVYFDANSGAGTMTLGANVSCKRLECGASTVTLAFSTQTLTLAGSGTVFNGSSAVTITPGTSTIKLTDASSTTKLFNGAGKTFNNLWLTGAGTGAFTIIGSNTFADFKCDTPPHTINFEANSTQTVTTFTVSGTAGNLMTLQSTVTGQRYHLVKSPVGTVSCDYLSIRDSSAS